MWKLITNGVTAGIQPSSLAKKPTKLSLVTLVLHLFSSGFGNQATLLVTKSYFSAFLMFLFGFVISSAIASGTIASFFLWFIKYNKSPNL